MAAAMIHNAHATARTKKLRVLMVGAGSIAGGLDRMRPAGADPYTHAGAFADDGRFEIVACVEPDPVTRVAFSEDWSIKQSFATLAEVPKNFEVDVVSICSPTASHAADARASLRLRPALIFCEKPVTPSVVESERLVALCAAEGVKLAINHTRRWAPDVIELRRDLDAGRWGELRSIQATYTKGVLNNGAHLIDLIHSMVGEPLEVLWAGVPRFDFWPDDPTIPATLLTSGGVPVQLAAGDAGEFARFELELLTSKAAITMEDGGLRWRIREPVDSAEFSNYRVLDQGRFIEGRYGAAMRGAVANIHQALAAGEELASTGETALAAQRVCQDIRAASRAAEDE